MYWDGDGDGGLGYQGMRLVKCLRARVFVYVWKRFVVRRHWDGLSKRRPRHEHGLKFTHLFTSKVLSDREAALEFPRMYLPTKISIASLNCSSKTGYIAVADRNNPERLSQTPVVAVLTPCLNAFSFHLHRLPESFPFDGATTPAVPFPLLPVPFLCNFVKAEIRHLVVRGCRW